MASTFSSDRDLNQVLFEEKPGIRMVILNRPQLLNILTHEMVSQMKKLVEDYEVDAAVRLVTLTGKGKAFCVGGDVVRLFQLTVAGDWSSVVSFCREKLLLHYLIATYKKPLVILMNGAVMGGGAALSMNGSYRVVTENTVFAVPEASLGLPHDGGVCYFLSQLPGHFGEYLGLTGARISGAEMLQCGLATHFVFSKDLKSLENELSEGTSMDEFVIHNALKKFTHRPKSKQDGACTRLDIINKCFSMKTVEEILSSLENEVESCGDKWIVDAINSIKYASPTSLKICLKSIIEGRSLTLEECLMHDYKIIRHIAQRRLSNDFVEGLRARFFDKDEKPQWEPPKLQEVSDDFVKQFFASTEINDDWDCLELPDRKIVTTMRNSKL
ncbi:hypothetical protein Pfo_005405 [Paulownia fortunei]|nr:hypothetical protein Pfo_005405 [Paulownia fortunei]